MRTPMTISVLFAVALAAGCAAPRSASRRAPLQRPVGAMELEQIARAVRPKAEVVMEGAVGFVRVTVVDEGATVKVSKDDDTVDLRTDFGGMDPTPEQLEATLALQRDLAEALDRAGITAEFARAPLRRVNFAR